jgi:hypothetical protein
MGKKRSKGILIFGWFEVIFGLLGSLECMAAFTNYLMSLYRLNTTTIARPVHYMDVFIAALRETFAELNLIYSAAISKATVPCFFILISGILILKLKPLGIKLNVFLLPLLLLATAFGMIINYLQYGLPKEFTRFDAIWVGLLVIYFVLALIKIRFFARPQVTEQFE